MVNTVTKLLELSSQNAIPAPGSPANTSMTSGKKECKKVCGQSCKCGRGTGRADGSTRTGWTGADGRTGRAGGPGGRGSRADWADRGWAGRAGRIGLADGPGGPGRQAGRGDHVSRRRTGRTVSHGPGVVPRWAEIWGFLVARRTVADWGSKCAKNAGLRTGRTAACKKSLSGRSPPRTKSAAE